ncbi:hypothetical protein Dda_4018 [Drechslerella dactyloides]|uniref:Uncharacterized protein n=1 Tax=Drechslerella dactyloides TaxID=74499 RepID=A0AAD6IYZ9_DREDA|nr:hypothetical protein Dda_4018 [Drechslerella dactyloides]
MLPKAIGLLAVSAVVVSGAILPPPPPIFNDTAPWHFTEEDYDNYNNYAVVWEANLAYTDHDESWIRGIDDAWFEKDLMFPITVFNKTTQRIYINMNGIVSFDKPDWGMKTVPERPLPVTNCNDSPVGGCIPSTAILPLWRDLNLQLLPADLGYGSLVAITFQKHKSYPIPHHHFAWWACDKSAPHDPPTERETCGRATRNVRMTIDVEKPYIIMLDYWVFNTTAVGFGGTIGVQSEGQYLSVPASQIRTEAFSCTRVIFDTKAVTSKVIYPDWGHC